MNLAEIRKKAFKEKGLASAANKTGELTPSVTFNNKVSTPDAAVNGDINQSEIIPTLTEQPQELKTNSDVIQGAAVSPYRFNPLEAIMKGRAISSEVPDPEAETADREILGDTDYEEYLCFRVGDEFYAVNILEIKEIVKPRPFTEVPRSPSFVPGILSLRGVIIPVFDLRIRLNLEVHPDEGKVRIVVVRKKEEICGMIVDEVIQVLKIRNNMKEPPPSVLDGIDRDFVNGIGRHEGRMIILLNLETILDIGLR